MNLILQVVVVPNAQTNFRDNLLKFSLNVIHKVASHLGISAAMLSFQHNFFQEIRSPTVNKHARINRIASDTGTNKAFPLKETNPADFDKLEG